VFVFGFLVGPGSLDGVFGEVCEVVFGVVALLGGVGECGVHVACGEFGGVVGVEGDFEAEVVHLADAGVVAGGGVGGSPCGAGGECDVSADERFDEVRVFYAVDAVVYPVCLEEVYALPDVVDAVFLVDVAVGGEPVALLPGLPVDLCVFAGGVVLFVGVEAEPRDEVSVGVGLVQCLICALQGSFPVDAHYEVGLDAEVSLSVFSALVYAGYDVVEWYAVLCVELGVELCFDVDDVVLSAFAEELVCDLVKVLSGLDDADEEVVEVEEAHQAGCPVVEGVLDVLGCLEGVIEFVPRCEFQDGLGAEGAFQVYV